MKRPQAMPSGSLQRRIQAAEAAWDRKDFQEAIEILESASHIAPADRSILLVLGKYYGLSHDYAGAERCFEKALRLSAGQTEVLTAITACCQNFRNPEFEERYLRRACEQPAVPALTLVKMAELYERRRRLPEAVQLIDRALAKASGLPAALLLRARHERLADRLDSAETVLRSFLHKPIRSPWVHAQAWYELGTILDRRGDYDAAMQAILKAKAQLSSEAARRFKVNISYHDLHMVQTQISAGQLRRWFEAGATLQPQRRVALLGGHPRSGTTLLEQILDAHAEIVSAEETDLFRVKALPPIERCCPPGTPILDVLEAATPEKIEEGREDYFRFMKLLIGKPVGSRLLIDKNPILTAQIPSFLRIFPESRFLIALRDPRDVVLSRFMLPQPVSPLATPFLTLNGTVEAYTVVMGLWRTLKPILPAPFLEIHYENMIEDLESVARQTLDFLDMPWNPKVLGFNKHAQGKMVVSPTYADVTQPIYKRARGRWQHYQKYLEPHLAKLEPFVKAFGYG